MVVGRWSGDDDMKPMLVVMSNWVERALTQVQSLALPLKTIGSTATTCQYRFLPSFPLVWNGNTQTHDFFHCHHIILVVRIWRHLVGFEKQMFGSNGFSHTLLLAQLGLFAQMMNWQMEGVCHFQLLHRGYNLVSVEYDVCLTLIGCLDCKIWFENDWIRPLLPELLLLARADNASGLPRPSFLPSFLACIWTRGNTGFMPQ